MIANIYIEFSLKHLIDIGLRLELSWILNKTHPVLNWVIYLFVLLNIIYLLPKWSIDSE